MRLAGWRVAVRSSAASTPSLPWLSAACCFCARAHHAHTSEAYRHIKPATRRKRPQEYPCLHKYFYTYIRTHVIAPRLSWIPSPTAHAALTSKRHASTRGKSTHSHATKIKEKTPPIGFPPPLKVGTAASFVPQAPSSLSLTGGPIGLVLFGEGESLRSQLVVCVDKQRELSLFGRETTTKRGTRKRPS